MPTPLLSLHESTLCDFIRCVAHLRRHLAKRFDSWIPVAVTPAFTVALLAGLFPQQRVLSHYGKVTSGVLGY